MKKLLLAALFVPLLSISNSANAAFIWCTYGSLELMEQTPIAHWTQTTYEQTQEEYFSNSRAYTNQDGVWGYVPKILTGSPSDYGLTIKTYIYATLPISGYIDALAFEIFSISPYYYNDATPCTTPTVLLDPF